MKLISIRFLSLNAVAAIIAAILNLFPLELSAQVVDTSHRADTSTNVKIDINQAPAHAAFVLIEAAKIADRNGDHQPFKDFLSERAKINESKFEHINTEYNFNRSGKSLASGGGMLLLGSGILLLSSSILSEPYLKGAENKLLNKQFVRAGSAGIASSYAGSSLIMYTMYLNYDSRNQSNNENALAEKIFERDRIINLYQLEKDFLDSEEAWNFVEKNIVEFSVIALGVPQLKTTYSKLLKKQTLDQLNKGKVPGFWDLTAQNIENLKKEKINGVEKFADLVETIKIVRSRTEIPAEEIQKFERSPLLTKQGNLSEEEQRITKAKSEMQILEKQIFANRDLVLGLSEMQKGVKTEDVASIKILKDRVLKLIQWQERAVKLLQLSIQE